MENQIQDNYPSVNSINSETNSDQPAILANHDGVSPAPLASSNPVTSSSSNSSKTLLISVLSLAILVGAVLVGIEIGKNQSIQEANDLALIEEAIQMESSITMSPSPSQVVAAATSSPTISNLVASQSAAAETYQNMMAGFSIKYPAGWRKAEADNWVGFGPKEIGEDIFWVVSFYKNSEKTAAQIKAEAGMQFSDRVQTERAITINGLKATEIVTTTKSYPEIYPIWYSVSIIIEDRGNLFVISNGAQSDTNLNKMISDINGKESKLSFEDFYSSFRVY